MHLSRRFKAKSLLIYFLNKISVWLYYADGKKKQ